MFKIKVRKFTVYMVWISIILSQTIVAQNTYVKILLLLIPILFTSLFVAKGTYLKNKNRKWIHVFVLGYLLGGLISVFHSLNPIYSLSEFTVYASIVYSAYFTFNYFSEKDEEHVILDSIGTAVTLVAFIGFLFIWSDSTWLIFNNGEIRFRGIYVHPVAYGNFLLFGIIFLLERTFVKRGKLLNKLVYLLAILMLIFQIGLTQSRTPLFLLLVVAAYAILNIRKFQPLSKNIMFKMLGASISLIPIGIGILFLLEFHYTFIDFISRGDLSSLQNLSGRILMWVSAIDYLQVNWLYGNGFSMAGRLVYENAIYHGDIAEKANSIFGLGGGTHLHNAWLQAAVQTNLIGTISFLMIGFWIIRALLTLPKLTKSTELPFTYSITIPLVLIVLFLNTMVGSTPAIGKDIVLFVFFFSLFAFSKLVDASRNE